MQDGKRRMHALERLSRLQAQLRDLNRRRLLAFERERSVLESDLGVAIDALQRGDLMDGPQARLMANRVRAVQKRLDRLAEEEKAARRKADAHAIRARLARRALEDGGRRHRDKRERMELTELVADAIASQAARPT